MFDVCVQPARPPNAVWHVILLGTLCKRRIDIAGYLTIPLVDKRSKRMHYTADQYKMQISRSASWADGQQQNCLHSSCQSWSSVESVWHTIPRCGKLSNAACPTLCFPREGLIPTPFSFVQTHSWNRCQQSAVLLQDFQLHHDQSQMKRKLHINI